MKRTVRIVELGRNHNPAAAGSLNAGPRLALKGLAICLMLAFGSRAHALPVGGTVAAGSASIASSANSMTINQSTQNVAINWQSFSIGQGQGVQFVQPNSSAVALNRVLGQDPSSILGSLSANGKVFLVNPNGILFGPSAQVNVGGLVASTRNITDADFMAGRHRFAGTGVGDVVNQGSITAAGGQVALLGANVSNDGVIVANMGSVALVAGNAVTLDLAGDGLLSVSVDEGTVNAMVRNGGLIRANGGNVMLTAQAAGTLLRTTVNNTGVIEAQSIGNRNGVISLLGDMDSGTVSMGGTIDASGRGAGQTGGSVTATAHHVGLFGAHIDASGDAGGGIVLVGGGFQGNNPAVQSASATYMSPDATIAADGITNGDGGTVVLWSNDSTRAQGSITARGGAQGGNGGLIETSSGSLDVVGIRVSASAPNGSAGLWLLDPADVVIGAATTNATLIGNVFSPNSGVGAATVGVADLRAALEAGTGTDVTITTTNTGAPGTGAGDITIASALTWVNAAGDSTLTLNAAGDVNINAAVTATRGSLVVCCGQDINVREAITTTNGSVLLTAGRDINVTRSLLTPATEITVTDGNLTMCAGRDILLDNQLNPPAALFTVTNGNPGLVQGLGLGLGLVLSAGNGGTGPGPAGGTVTFTPGTLATVTAAPTTIFYNPVSYALADRTDFAPNITGLAPAEFMLVFPEVADRAFDGTTTATLTGLKNIPAGIDVTLTGAGIANFDTAAAGTDKIVTFTGFALGGADAGLFALPGAAVCCLPAVQRTTGDITAATSATVSSPAASTVSVLPLLPLLLAGPFPSDLGLTFGGIQIPAQLAALPTGAVGQAVVLPPEELPVPVVVPPVEVPVVPPLPPRIDRN